VATNRARFSRWVTLCGLGLLIAVILWPAPTVMTTAVSTPLAVLLLTGFRPPPKWGGWVAALIIPYVCIALGEAIVGGANRPTYAIVVAGAVVVFFAAMDFVRASGTNLRH
jgi:hypothetical protein